MIAVIFELQPGPDRRDCYFELAGAPADSLLALT